MIIYKIWFVALGAGIAYFGYHLFLADIVKGWRAAGRDMRNERVMTPARQLDAALDRCTWQDRRWLTAHYRASIAPDPDMTAEDLRRPL